MRSGRVVLAAVVPALLAAAPLIVRHVPAPQERSRDQERARDGGDEENGGELRAGAEKLVGPRARASALVADAARERLEPFLVPLDGGTALLGAVEHEVAVGDRIVLRTVRSDGQLVEGEPIVLDAAPARIVRPTGARERSGSIVIVWTQLVGGVPQLFFARGDGRRFAAGAALTKGALPNRNVEATAHSDGRVWLAWESWRAGASDARGSFDVLLAPLEGDHLGDAVVVGDGALSDLDPSLASRGGTLAITWSQYAGRDYEIRLRTYDPATKRLGPTIDVSADAASDDLHPSLAAASNGDLWIAWDRLEDPTRCASTPEALQSGIRSANEARSVGVRVACVRGDAVLAPGSGEVPGAPLLSWTGGVPRIVIDASGRVCLVYRWLERFGASQSGYGYPVLVQALGANGFGKPVSIEGSLGGPEEPAALLAGDRLLVAWQQDHRGECEATSAQRAPPRSHVEALATQQVLLNVSFAPSGIGVASLALADVPSESGAPTLAPRAARLAPPHFHPMADPVGDAILSGRDHFQIQREGARAGDGSPTYNVYWGDLHRHSSVSRCTRGIEPRPEQRYEFGRDVCLYDFMALTDHSSHVDALAWWRLDELCDVMASPGFCTLAAFEWSTAKFGHQNVILRGSLRPFLSSVVPPVVTPEKLYSLLPVGSALAIPHHPADVTRQIDFARCNPELVRLVEIYQAQRGNYEFDGCWRQSATAQIDGSYAQDALARGLRVGFVASTDHGNGASYACVLAEKLDRDHLFDALLARRTYGATTKGILVDFRVDGHLMGEELRASAPPRVRARLRGAADLAEVVVFRNGKPWQVVGRPPPREDSPIELTLEIVIARPEQPPPGRWKVRVTSPDVTFAEWFTLPQAHRETDKADRPHWWFKDVQGVFVWPEGYKDAYRSIESRLRVRGARNAKIKVESGTAFKDGRGEMLRELTLAELATANLGGRSSFGSWQLHVRESPDGDVDPAHGLHARDFEREWIDDSAAQGETWYYVRAIQEDGEMAWSSPIWVKRE